MSSLLKVYSRIVIPIIIPVLLCFSYSLHAQETAKNKIHINKSQQYDDKNVKKSSVNVSIKNVTQENIPAPVRAVIDSIDIPGVTVVNADGITSYGKPYFDYSTLIGSDNVLSPNETSGVKTWIFDNPFNDKFTYSVNIVSEQSNVDTTPPTIIITNPVSNSVISHNTPYITIGYRDEGSGVDPGSIFIEIDGIDQTANFGVTPSYAMYHLTAGLSSGSHEMIVSLSDNAGNVNIIVSNFTVQTSSTPCEYLFSLKGNPWIFASPGDGTYTEYMDPDSLGISEESDPASLSMPTLFEGVFFSFLQGGVYQSSGEGSYGLYLNNTQLGLSESVRLNALDMGFMGDPILFCALGYGGIFQTMGSGVYSSYLSNTQLGISKDAVIDALHKDYRDALYFHITGQGGIYEHFSGTNSLFLTEADLGVPGAVLDGFDILPEQVQPVITISSPANGASLSTATPGMAVSFSDADSGIATSTFKALLDGADVTSFFTVTNTGASWQVPSASPLTGMNHTLNVSVSDRAGNQASAVSHFSISVNHPPAASISASPLEITIGDSAVLSWTSSNAATVTIDNGIGAVAPNGSITVSPQETTTYTIIASNANGTATDSVTVTVSQTLGVSLSAQPQAITEGGSSTLSWTSSLADSASLDNGIGPVAVNGSITVTPLQTTTYTITVQGQGETASASTTVTVLHAPSVTLTATPDAIAEGASSTLAWSSSHADSASINQGIGSVALNGSRQVNPLVTTTYTITVVGTGGTSTASAQVTVHSKPVVSFTASPVEIFQGESSTLSWSCTNADAISIDNGIGSVGPEGTLTVKPATTTTYTLTATGPGGSTTRTATVTVKSLISFTITSPVNGSQINRPDTLVRGIISTPFTAEMCIVVNGVPAMVYGNSFAANHVPLVEGSNVVTVQGVDSQGHSAENSITVNASTADPYITLNSTYSSGVSPLVSTFRAVAPFSTSQTSLWAEGPGTVELVSYADDNGFNLRMTGVGIFYITADVGGYTDTVAVLVSSMADLDVLLREKWDGMKTCLMNHDIQGAMEYFAMPSKGKYQEIFTLLNDSLPAVVAGMEGIERISIDENVAEYRIKKDEVIGGVNERITYYIYFAKDTFGHWYIYSF